MPKYDPIKQTKNHPRSLALAIEAKCWECCGGGQDGVAATKSTIAGCPCVTCPLHPHRPHQPTEGVAPKE